MSPPVLRLTEVSRVYASGEGTVRALDAVSLEVADGELVAVMGPSGSGKSTLLALAGGLDTPTSGSIEVEGTKLDGLDSTSLARLRRDRIGYVFQDFNLITDLTAAENIALPRELAGVGVRTARREALTAMAELDLAGLANRFPDQLSGGQQQLSTRRCRSARMWDSWWICHRGTLGTSLECIGRTLNSTDRP